MLAVSFFERNVLSLRQAAKLAELHLWDFIQLLNQHGIPIAEYDDEEIQQELKTVESFVQQIAAPAGRNVYRKTENTP